MSKKAKVLLLKPLPGKGNAGDIVEVKAHYANYVLLPEGIAVYYDKQTQNQHEAHKKRIDAFNKDFKKSVTDLANKLESEGIKFEKNATDNGGLYDSISAKTLAIYAQEVFNINVSSDYFVLDPKIESIGEYTAEFNYDDIAITFPINVVKEGSDNN